MTSIDAIPVRTQTLEFPRLAEGLPDGGKQFLGCEVGGRIATSLSPGKFLSDAVVQLP